MKEREKEWWQPLKTARGEFFDELQRTGVMKKEESEYPEPTENIQKLLDTYYSFTKGTGERTRYANSHPELKDHWNKVAEYYNKVAGAFGIPPTPPFGFTGSGSRYSSKYGPKSDYEKQKLSNLKAKNKARITKSIKEMLKKPKKTKRSTFTKPRIPKLQARKSIKAMLVKKPKFPTFSYKFAGKTVS